MKKNNYIVLLDPSLQDNDGTLSHNLGDLVIYDAVKDVLDELFPNEEIIRISTHVPFEKKEKDLINNARLAFVGGTNILTSDVRNFPRLTPLKKKGFYLFPGFKDITLVGAGWASYQQEMDWATRLYYKRILNKTILHSVRDIYSLTKLANKGFTNVLHTSCPSTWKLDPSFVNKFNPRSDTLLFTLTSYYPDVEADNMLLDVILTTGAEKIYFFPQTQEDSSYLSSLQTFKKNTSRFILLSHTKQDLDGLISSTSLNYIGNRLHGGIHCLASKHPSMIVSVDNRATEMGNSINLNVTGRNDPALLQKWISNAYTPPSLNLPGSDIKRWKDQFSTK